MVTIDGSTVTKSEDFERLKTQYGQPHPRTLLPEILPATPATPHAPARTRLSLLRPPSLLLLTIPPASVWSLNCLAPSALPPGTNSTAISVINGQLLGTACGLLSTSGGNCNDIV
jgi:hypothetical protein